MPTVVVAVTAVVKDGYTEVGEGEGGGGGGEKRKCHINLDFHTVPFFFFVIIAKIVSSTSVESVATFCLLSDHA